ncbi:MAG: hypothetical protein RL226_2224 [Bacteroidota bacterium]
MQMTPKCVLLCCALLGGASLLHAQSCEVSRLEKWQARNRARVNMSSDAPTSQAENPRLVAIGLTVALGPFGAHRLYLGTGELVPVFYSATLGGGLGILPVVDLGHLIFAKDLSPFVNNKHVFMWTGRKRGEAEKEQLPSE